MSKKLLDIVKPGVATGAAVQEIFAHARANKFALPAVNVISTDSINAVLESASKARSAVIVQVSNGGAQFFAGKGVKLEGQQAQILGSISAARHVHLMAEHYGVPVIMHTDHCPKKRLPWIDGLLDAGEKHFEQTGKPLFSSHMLDLSEESLQENIEICSKYLARMAKLGMTLEIELGCTGGEEDGVDNSGMDHSELYTQPEDVGYAYEHLSKISKNFSIAASFGNVHGVYSPGNVKLTPDPSQLSKVRIRKVRPAGKLSGFRLPRWLGLNPGRNHRGRQLRCHQDEHRHGYPVGLLGWRSPVLHQERRLPAGPDR